MQKLLCPLLLICFVSCDNHAFDADKRQILAKDQLRSIFRGKPGFSITGFREDTLPAWHDSTFKNPLRYTLDFSYLDSTGAIIKKQDVVIFSQEGATIIDSRIVDLQ